MVRCSNICNNNSSSSSSNNKNNDNCSYCNYTDNQKLEVLIVNLKMVSEKEKAMFEKLKGKLNDWMTPKDTCQADMLYQQLFLNTVEGMDWEMLSENCGVDIGKRPIQIGIIKLNDEKDRQEQLGFIVKECRKTSDSDEVLPVNDGDDQIILLFYRDTLWEEQAREILEDIRKALTLQWTGLKPCITLGEMEEYSADIPAYWRKSFKTAVGLQDYRYVKPQSKVIAYTDIVERRKIYPKGIAFRFDLIKTYLENENPEALQAWLSGIYSVLSHNKEGTFGLGYHITLEIVVNAISLFRENGLIAENHIQSPEMLIYEVLSLKTSEEMREFATDFLNKCRTEINRNTTEKAL